MKNTLIVKNYTHDNVTALLIKFANDHNMLESKKAIANFQKWLDNHQGKHSYIIKPRPIVNTLKRRRESKNLIKV